MTELHQRVSKPFFEHIFANWDGDIDDDVKKCYSCLNWLPCYTEQSKQSRLPTVSTDLLEDNSH